MATIDKMYMNTTKQALFDIAEAVAGKDVSADYPQSKKGAIDAIADALAGEDVDAGGSIAGAVKILSEYVGSGGSSAFLKIINLSAKPHVNQRTKSEEFITIKVSGGSSAGYTSDTTAGCYTQVEGNVASGTELTVMTPSGQKIPFGTNGTKTVYFFMPVDGAVVDWTGGGIK